jgi:hypothetical protein
MEDHPSSAEREIWRQVDIAWDRAARPSAGKISTIAQEHLDRDVPEATIRGWVNRKQPRRPVPRTDEDFLAVIQVLGAATQCDWKVLLSAARESVRARGTAPTQPGLIPAGTTPHQPDHAPAMNTDSPAEISAREDEPGYPATNGQKAGEEGAGQADPPVVAPRRSRRRALTTVAVAGTAILLAAVVSAAVSHGDDSDGAAGATERPAGSKRCAQVRAAVSPVFVNIGDVEPLKHKGRTDRVVLVDIPQRTQSGVRRAAVLLPKEGDSPTGYGWMRAEDLTAASCEGAPPPLGADPPALPNA